MTKTEAEAMDLGKDLMIIYTKETKLAATVDGSRCLHPQIVDSVEQKIREPV